MNFLAVLLSLALTPWIASAAEPAAFPGALGTGGQTPGGRGGQILRVTTLAADGPGSFAEALRKEGPRMVVFEVGGVIDLAGRDLKISHPFVTIAGQTAPSPGITLIKGSLMIHTHDVVVRHLRVRPGEAGRPKKSGWNADSVSTVNAARVIIDHCSCTWATDENLSASGSRFGGSEKPEEWRQVASHGITISHCLIAEGLANSTHAKGEHSKGTLLHDNSTDLLVVGNLFASNVERNPLAKGGVEATIVNNWIFNPRRRAIHHALVPEEWKGHEPQTSRLCIAGNVLQHGPDTPPQLPLFTNHGRSPLSLYLHDNLALDRDGNDARVTEGVAEDALVKEAPDGLANLQLLPAAKIRRQIARQVGARPWDRDAIDERIVLGAIAGEGKVIDSENEVGGYPKPAETRAPFREEEWDMATLERRGGTPP